MPNPVEGVLTLDANTALHVHCAADGCWANGLKNCKELAAFCTDCLSHYAFAFNETLRAEYGRLMGVSVAKHFIEHAARCGRALPIEAEALPAEVARRLRVEYRLHTVDRHYLETANATDTRILVSHDEDFRRRPTGKPRGTRLDAHVRRECDIHVFYVDEAVEELGTGSQQELPVSPV
jgi:hypothetical protein